MNNCYDRRFATIIDFYYFLNSSLTDLRHHHLPDLLVLEGHLHLVLEGHFNLVLSMERSSTVGGGIVHNTNLSHHHLSRWSLPLLESCLHLALPMERSSTVRSNEATYTDLSHYRLSDRSLSLLDDCLHPIERQALCKTGIPISDLSQYHLSQWSHLLLQGSPASWPVIRKPKKWRLQRGNSVQTCHTIVCFADCYHSWRFTCILTCQ